MHNCAQMKYLLMMYFFFTNEIIRDLLNMKCNKLKLILILENEEISQFDFYFV